MVISYGTGTRDSKKEGENFVNLTIRKSSDALET